MSDPNQLEISIAGSEAEFAAVRGLVTAFAAWAHASIPGSQDAPAFEGLAQELAQLPGPYAPPAGRVLLATQGAQPAGCIFLKPCDATSAEIKRFFVLDAFRGRQIGRRLLARLLDEARGAGYRTLVLDTHRSMKRAREMYRDAGFFNVDAPPGFPPALRAEAVFMRCQLSANCP